MSVVHNVGNVFYLCKCWATSIDIDESVFTVLLRKCGSFKEERTMDSTHSCLDYVGRGYNILSYLISVQVWGIGCHLSSSGFYHNLLRDNEINSTLSFCALTGAGVGPDIIIHAMKKFITIMTFMMILSVPLFSQNTIKFLGIPIDGTKQQMITALESKGFEYNHEYDILSGEFNGTDVDILIQTVNNEVWRLAICDRSGTSEENIKIRFNILFRQFLNNGKYYLSDGNVIDEDEDISYEMLVRNKRYEASFILNDGTPGLVWYMILGQSGEYRIAMYYENTDNKADGSDL